VFSNEKGKCVPMAPKAASVAPPGSYTKSCVNIQFDPATQVLTALCKVWYSAGTSEFTTGVRVTACRPGGDISNINGEMRCEARAGTWGEGMAVPNGHYLTNGCNSWAVLPYTLPDTVTGGEDFSKPPIVNGAPVAQALAANCMNENGVFNGTILDLTGCIMGKDIEDFNGTLVCNGTRPLPQWPTK
jgi:hypothetical protein